MSLNIITVTLNMGKFIYFLVISKFFEREIFNHEKMSFKQI